VICGILCLVITAIHASYLPFWLFLPTTGLFDRAELLWEGRATRHFDSVQNFWSILLLSPYCSEYSKSISVGVAKARCPELWSKWEEDKRWLSETVVLRIGSWHPRYEINKAGRSQTTLSYFCNIFAKAAMLKEVPQYPRNGCQGSGLGSFTREIHVRMAGWAIS
jgi:hypothetical protein